MKKINIEEYISTMEKNGKRNAEIKKEIWDKEVHIIIPNGNRVKEISREQLFVMKLIFYLDYISITNLKIILSPLMNESKAENMINELVECDLLKFAKKGFYGTFYYLSKYGLGKLTGEKSEGEYPITNISNATLEAQDYKHLYLAEIIIYEIVSNVVLPYVKENSAYEEKNIRNLYLKNIAFDLMRMLPDTDRRAHLGALGYSEKEISRVEALKTYSPKEREKYAIAVYKKNDDKYILGYESYFERYKNLLMSKRAPFYVEHVYYDFILSDKKTDYLSIIEQTVRGVISEENGVRHNMIKYQTEELRKGITYYANKVRKKNGLSSKESYTVQMDRRIDLYLERINILNAICVNLKRTQEGYIKSGVLHEDELPYYEQTIEYLKKYTDKKYSVKKEYLEEKKMVLFKDTKSKINEESRAMKYLTGFENKNVFVRKVEPKVNKDGKCVLHIVIVNIDRNKSLKNFNASRLRRDYFGILEFFQSIRDELEIPIFIEYIYCYPEGSNITGYEDRLKKIFNDGNNAQANKQLADKFVVKEIKKYIPVAPLSA